MTESDNDNEYLEGYVNIPINKFEALREYQKKYEHIKAEAERDWQYGEERDHWLDNLLTAFMVERNFEKVREAIKERGWCVMCYHLEETCICNEQCT